MKKLIFLSLIALICLPAAAYAASIGGADTQGQGKFGISLDQEFVFDKDLEISGTSFTLAPNEEIKDVAIDKMYRTMVKTSYGLSDDFDIYLKLGIADLDAEENFYLDGECIAEGEHIGRNALAYGFGFKGKHDLENNYLIGVDLQWLRHKNKYSHKWNIIGGIEETSTGKATIEEYHIAPYVAKRIENYIPYIGVKYSDLKAKLKDNEGDQVELEADNNFGIFIGTDYQVALNWSLNFETRFIDETAISFGGAYRF